MSPVFRFWAGWKNYFYVAHYLIRCEHYHQTQGNRNYISNSSRNYTSNYAISAALVHYNSQKKPQGNLFPKEKKEKSRHKLQDKPRSVLVFWYLHIIWPILDVWQLLQIIHEREYVKMHFKLYKPHIPIHAWFFILEISLQCSGLVFWVFLINYDRWCMWQRMKHLTLHIKNYWNDVHISFLEIFIKAKHSYTFIFYSSILKMCIAAGK